MTTEADAWKKFNEYIDKVRPLVAGKFVPVALILLPVEASTPAAIQVSDTIPAVLWPADFPMADRAPLLEKIARAYRTQGVLTLPGSTT
jgi:hypothetical protein